MKGMKKLSFTSNLKQKMNELEISQVDLAKGINKGKSSISQYLTGKHIPQQNVKEDIANFLNCTVEDLEKEFTQDLNINTCNNVPIWKAAMILGKSEEFVRIALQMGTAPFGFASKKKSKWSYHISPKKFKEYVGEYEERNE